MPQEGKRSMGYRPFMRCNDPRGVVERGNLKKHRNVVDTATTHHLLEVSRGAQKLNHVVSSWSCGYTNTNQTDMAKDLLKGALDLGESLVMLTRLQQSSGAGNVYSDPSSEEACCEAPSTSSSTQSSIVNSSNLVSPESLVSSAASKRKSKRPKGLNMIAKLVGLEDASLRCFQYDDGKHVGGGEKIVNQKKPDFDFDSSSPRARHDPLKSGWRRRRLDQMIDALKFKGSLKSTLSTCQSESSNSKERCGGANGDHKPPIVVMKPSRFSCLNMDHPFIPKLRAEVDQEMLLNMRIRINPLAETDISGNPNFHDNEMLDRSPSRNFDKRAQEERKTSGRKGERKRTPKSESHLQSSDGDKLTCLKPKSSRKAKDTLINLLQSDTTNTGRQGIRSSSNSNKNCPENAENVFDEAIEYVNCKQRYRDENGEVHGICEMGAILPLEDSTTLAEDASQIEITDYVDDDKETQCSSSDGMPVEEGSATTSQVEQEVKHMPVASSTHLSSSRKGSNKLKSLLLSSPLFLRRVEELFGLKESSEKDVLQETGNEIDLSDQSSRMILDCANELVELRGCECCRARLPLSSTECYSWLEQLVDEVCDRIEALRCYRKDDDNGGSADNLVVLVKGDLKSGKMVSGVWDMGWRNPGSGDEIVEFVKGMEEVVLDGLIEEILVDLTI